MRILTPQWPRSRVRFQLLEGDRAGVHVLVLEEGRAGVHVLVLEGSKAGVHVLVLEEGRAGVRVLFLDYLHSFHKLFPGSEGISGRKIILSFGIL